MLILPVEIRQMILRLACAPSKDDPRVGRVQTNFTPLIISHVCKALRELAISDPQLWSTIFCYADKVSKPNSRLMDLYLERSRPQLLDVSLDLPYYGDFSYSPPDAKPLLSTLFSDFERWKTAQLFISFGWMNLDMWEQDLYSKLRAPVSSLESLEVSCTIYLDGKFNHVVPSLLWKNAPRLTKLAIELGDLVVPDMRIEYDEDIMTDDEEPDYTVYDWVLKVGIPYHQLTHLQLDVGPNSHLAWAEIVTIFAQAPNLTSCSLGGIDNNCEIPPDSPPQHIVLQHLKHLYLSGPHNVTPRINLLPDLNEKLTAPSLQTLHVVNLNEMWDKDAYTRFITRSQCSLSEIHYEISPRNDKSVLLHWINLSSPTLRSISSNHVAMLGIEFARSMSGWDELAREFELCPGLEEMSIRTSLPTFNGELPHMINMLRKRCCPPDGSSGVFTKVSLPVNFQRFTSSLKVLVKESYSLHVHNFKPQSEMRTIWGGE